MSGREPRVELDGESSSEDDDGYIYYDPPVASRPIGDEGSAATRRSNNQTSMKISLVEGGFHVNSSLVQAGNSTLGVGGSRIAPSAHTASSLPQASNAGLAPFFQLLQQSNSNNGAFGLAGQPDHGAAAGEMARNLSQQRAPLDNTSFHSTSSVYNPGTSSAWDEFSLFHSAHASPYGQLSSQSGLIRAGGNPDNYSGGITLQSEMPSQQHVLAQAFQHYSRHTERDLSHPEATLEASLLLGSATNTEALQKQNELLLALLRGQQQSISAPSLQGADNLPLTMDDNRSALLFQPSLQSFQASSGWATLGVSALGPLGLRLHGTVTDGTNFVTGGESHFLAVPPPPKSSAQHRIVLLYNQRDEEALSPYQCLVRKQIELFEAGEIDISGSAQGRNRPIALAQVGIRCIYCAPSPIKKRARGSVYFPSTLISVYQTAQNMANGHLLKHCTHIPKDTRSDLIRVRLREDSESQNTRKSAFGAGRQYWAAGLRAIGVVETEERRLRFDDRLYIPSKDEQESSSGRTAL